MYRVVHWREEASDFSQDCTSERVNRRLLQGKADGTDSVRSPQRLIMTRKVGFEGTNDDLFGPVVDHSSPCLHVPRPLCSDACRPIEYKIIFASTLIMSSIHCDAGEE